MLTFITLAGFLLLLTPLLFKLKNGLEMAKWREKSVARKRYGEEPPPQPKPLKFGFQRAAIAIGVIMLLSKGLVFYAEPGYYYFVQYPFSWMGVFSEDGTQQAAITSPGFHARLFANLRPFKQFLTVAFGDEGEGDIFTAKRPAIDNVRFNDTVTAEVRETIRFEMPTDKKQFKEMAVAFRSQENLVNSALIPFVGEVTKNAARLIAAQEFIVGRGGEFEVAVLDQLNHGIYVLETAQLVDAGDEGDELIKQEDQRRVKREEVVRLLVSKKRDPVTGEPVRKDHPYSRFGVTTAQATVSDVDFESEFKTLVKKQRDKAAEAALERESTRTAEFAKQRTITEGETEKAKIRVEQEKEQITRLISAETKRKEQSELAEAAKLEALKIRTLADAEAYQRTAVMRADNALSLRLETARAMNKDTWEAIAKMSGGTQLVPHIMVGGGKGGEMTVQDFMGLVSIDVLKRAGLDSVGSGGK